MFRNKRKRIEDAFAQLTGGPIMPQARSVQTFNTENAKMEYVKRSIGCRTGFRPASNHSLLENVHFSEKGYNPW